MIEYSIRGGDCLLGGVGVLYRGCHVNSQRKPNKHPEFTFSPPKLRIYFPRLSFLDLLSIPDAMDSELATGTIF